MPKERYWSGKNLYNLLYLVNRDNFWQYFPDQNWTNIKNKRKLYRRRIRLGEVDPPMPDNSDGDTGMLRQENARLKRELDTAREKTLEYMAALRAAVFEASADLKINPPKARVPKVQAHGTPETACLAVSDLQLGKETPTYNIAVCEERMKLLAEKVIEIAKMQEHHHPVRELHLHLLGDIVEGESIFPGQAHQIHAGLFRQMVDGQRILINLITDLLSFFDNIHVVGVIGNHGALKLKGEVDPETNMDRLLYEVVRSHFTTEPRVTWDIPSGKGQRNFYAINRIYDWGFMLAHGDQIRGWGGIPFYGALKKALGWADAISDPWDFLMVGHHHTPTRLTYNKRVVIFNGTTESDNEFALEVLAATGHPTQWLGFIHPEHGVSSEYWLSLSEKKPKLTQYKEFTK